MREITIQETNKKIEDILEKKGAIILSLNGVFGTVFIPYIKNLQVSETGDQIVMEDDNDINIAINQSSISRCTLSTISEFEEQVDLDLEDIGISLNFCTL